MTRHKEHVATCWIVAGPNGAGKTTFALNYLPQVASCSRFINADLIAAGHSPLAPERELLAASRIFLQEIEEVIADQEDFAFETTLSGRGGNRGRTPISQEVIGDGPPFPMNDGGTPEPVFEQHGPERQILNDSLFETLSKESRL
ncbi:hypothetical protein ACM26W_17470 [Halomonas sp. HK25]|uniref:hypothetical protein n=1 Tax=Halomonas sp. HK25 TaxID=3394321 RepID=UPI0039FBA590